MSWPHWIHKFEIKPNSWVFVPDDQTAIRGREIKEVISSHWKPPYYYAHFKQGGHVSALKRHLKNNLFVQADIKQFFNQVNKSKVTRSVHSILKGYEQSREIACESTVPFPNSDPINFILPFGFVQSPILASLCLNKSALGSFLHSLPGKGYEVSVYMDDIIISSSLPLDEVSSMLEELKYKADKSKFELNQEKTHGPVDQITAFNISLSKNSLTITDDRLTEFERRLVETENEYVINGILGYIQTVNPKQMQQFMM